MEDILTPSDLISMNDLSEKLIAETDPDKLKELTDIFNMTQAKKEILRLEKYNQLIDAVTNQMQERISKKPGDFSNKDLIDYLNAASSNIEKARKSFDVVENTPSIQINQVNIESKSTNMSRESREKITQAIMSILNKVDVDIPGDQVQASDSVLLNEEEEN